MKRGAVSVLVGGLLLSGWFGTGSLAAQEQDLVAAVKKGTEELSAVDRVVAAARNALLSATNNLDPERFNSAAYNARITSEQLEAAKDKYEKASPGQKESALEAYELAQELAELRRTEFENAERVLPAREAEAKAADEKYAATLATALKLADQIKDLVRKSESNAQASLDTFKLATEQAAFAKATAEQQAAANAQVSKSLAELVSADSVLQQAAAALQRARSEDRSQKQAEVEKAITALAVALHAAIVHLPVLTTGQGSCEVLKTTAPVVEADRNLQKASAALEQAGKDVEDKAKALTQAANRVKAAQESVEKRVAKVSARKDLVRERLAAKRAETSRQEAEAMLPQRAADVERAQQQYAAAIEAAIQSLLLSPESASSLQAERDAVGKAIADREAKTQRENESLAREAAATQAAADKARAALDAANKTLAERVALRETLERTLRQRFLREAGIAVEERRRTEAALASASRGLQPKVAAYERASAALRAAEKRADEAARAASDAMKNVSEAQAVVVKATADKDAAEGSVSQYRQVLAAAPAKLAAIRGAFYGGLKPLQDSEWDYAKARHLLVRAGFGGTPDEVTRLHAMGLHGAVNYLVNFKSQPPADVEFAAYPRERPQSYESALSGEEQRRLREARVATDRQQIQNMRTWWMRRMIESSRPLEEKLTLFWHGHFASQYSDVGDSYYMYLQNQLFRDHAAGNFAALLYGIAHDAAMLKYLNNDTNVKGRANENLAREIMELFGMGRDQGYSETDIRQGARALTGFTYDAWTGQFRFISSRHDTDPKNIFGKQGNWNGDDFVQLILDTPYPPKFIARQLLICFAHDEPSPDTVEALANVLRYNNYELAPMLENLFLSEEFYSARTMGRQVKGPIQLVVGLHRDLGLKEPDVAYLVSAAREMGQDLFEPPSVFGWQAGRTWVTTSRTFSRYNALAEILETRPRGGKTGVDVVGTLLSGNKFEDHAAVVDHLIKCCLSVPLSKAKRQALVEFLQSLPPPAAWEANPGPANARLTRLLVMLICSPEYQLS
ncbi:MAG: DUF1800 family protein [Planctomycetes bacterium]|nr:DUF1800 family protein [Planctomycetota bacterium]